MSGNGDLPHPPPTTHNFTFLSIFSKGKLTSPNYMDWLHNLKMMLRYEKKEYVLDTPVPEIDKEFASPKEIVEYNQHVDDATKVTCIMIATMVPKLHNTYED